MKRAFAAMAVAATLLVSCGNSASVAPSVTPPPRDGLDASIRWADSTTETCADWNGFSNAEQSTRASGWLTIVRNFDRPGGAMPSADQVALFVRTITDLCSGGSDCDNPDYFCDDGKAAEAALAAYTTELQQLRP